MNAESNIGDAYNVSLTDDGQVCLELIVKRAEFPAFSLVLPAAQAVRIGKALLAIGDYAVSKAAVLNQAAGGAHGS